MRTVAVVVDDRWHVAVVGGRLPELPSEELAAAELRTRHGLAVSVVTTLRTDTVAAVVATASGPGSRLEWWPPTRAIGELLDAEERRLVRKATGPC